LTAFPFSFGLTGESDSGEFAIRWIISGGGEGLRYRPKANAATAISTTISKGPRRALPMRRAQISQSPPPSHACQRFRVSRLPHSLQKFRCTVGGSSDLTWRDYIQIARERNKQLFARALPASEFANFVRQQAYSRYSSNILFAQSDDCVVLIYLAPSINQLGLFIFLNDYCRSLERPRPAT